MYPHRAPEIPWEKVGVDLFELDRQTFLIAVDYYSGLFEVQDMTSTVASRVITVLKSWFAQHGIPITMMSDNGPPFNSENFQEFSEEWDFNHITSSPHYPQSNGKVENAVKTCKSLLKKARDDKQDPLPSILEWRTTPTEGIGASPAQLLYGRRTRTCLPVARKQLKPTLIEGMTKMIKKNKEKQKLPVQTELSDAEESTTDETTDELAEVEATGGQRSGEDGKIRRSERIRRAPKYLEDYEC